MAVYNAVGDREMEWFHENMSVDLVGTNVRVEDVKLVAPTAKLTRCVSLFTRVFSSDLISNRETDDVHMAS